MEATPSIASKRGTMRSSMKRRCWLMSPGVPGSCWMKKKVRLLLAPSAPACSTGGLASRGSGGRRFRREITSTAADFMSLPTAKVRSTPPKPLPMFDSIDSRPGSPCSTRSSGSTISDSSSRGEAARQSVCTESCGRSMSGKSCSGRRNRASPPNSRTRANTAATAGGLRSAFSVRFIGLGHPCEAGRTVRARHDGSDAPQITEVSPVATRRACRAMKRAAASRPALPEPQARKRSR